MSTIWPFFNTATPNTNILNILNDIDTKLRVVAVGNAAAKAARSVALGSSSSKDSLNNNDKAAVQVQDKTKSILITPPTQPTTLLDSPNILPDLPSTAGLSPHVAYSPGTVTKFGVTASELLHSIKQNNDDVINGNTSGPSDVISITGNSQHNDTQSSHLLIANGGDQNLLDSILDKSANHIFTGYTPIPLDTDHLYGSHHSHPVELLNLLLDQPNLLDELNHPNNFTSQKASSSTQKQSKLAAYLSTPEVIGVLNEYILVGFYLSKIINTIRLLNPNPANDEDVLNINSDWVSILTSKWHITRDQLDFIWCHDILKEVETDPEETDAEGDDQDDILNNNPLLVNNIGGDKSDQTTSSGTQSVSSFNTASDTLPSLASLMRALNRSSIASELLILPSTGIEQVLLKNTSLLERLWRGIMNCDNYWVSGRDEKDDDSTKTNFNNNDKNETTNNENRNENENDNDNENEDTNDDDNISILSTDSQKLVELEQENQYDKLRDAVETVLFNNFLKLIDDLTASSANAVMNFIRFEQVAAGYDVDQQNDSHFEQEVETKTFTDQLISHLSHSPTMCDLLVRSISLDKPFASTGLIELLSDQGFIARVLNRCMEYANDHLVQDCLCGVLNGIVGISSNIGFWDDANNGGVDENGAANNNENNSLNNPNIGPNDLTRKLVSKECVELMIDIIVNGGKYGLVTVVSVVIELIRKNNSDYDEFDWINCVFCVTNESVEGTNSDDANKNEKRLPSSRDPIYLGTLLKAFSFHLPRIVKRYLSSDYYKHEFTFGFWFANQDGVNKHSIPSSIGKPVEALGYERFKIMELLAELLHCSNMMLMNKKCELDFLLWKRENLRHKHVLQDWVGDALDSTIGNNKMDDISLAEVTSNLDTVHLKDKGSSSSTNCANDYLPTAFELSIGNYFKYQLMNTNTVPLITLKIFRFPWNNFMHNVVFDLIQQIFNGRLANWDEDRAVNQEETVWDDNLSLNKNLIWSLFGEYNDYEKLFDSIQSNANDDYICPNKDFPGFFNLPAFILFLFNKSNELYNGANFRYGYMGHLTLIAEEIHKFQNYVENFGLTKSENAFGLKKEEDDSERAVWWKSSYFVFEELWETIFNGGEEIQITNEEELDKDSRLKQKYDFSLWLRFVETNLRDISAMYNKVLGNPNELESENENASSHNLNDDNKNTYFDPSDIIDEELGPEVIDTLEMNMNHEDTHLGLSRDDVLRNMPLEEQPLAQGAILLDNGDNEDFKNGDSVTT